MKKIEVVAAIIKKDNKFFASQRGYGEFKGGWEFPGGKLEEGESHLQALKREMREELNVNIEVLEHIHTVNYQYPNFYLTMHCYLSRISDGQIELLEHEDARWVTKDELDQLDWLEADIEVVEKIKELNEN